MITDGKIESFTQTVCISRFHVVDPEFRLRGIEIFPLISRIGNMPSIRGPPGRSVLTRPSGDPLLAACFDGPGIHMLLKRKIRIITEVGRYQEFFPIGRPVLETVIMMVIAQPFSLPGDDIQDDKLRMAMIPKPFPVALIFHGRGDVWTGTLFFFHLSLRVFPHSKLHTKYDLRGARRPKKLLYR